MKRAAIALLTTILFVAIVTLSTRANRKDAPERVPAPGYYTIQASEEAKNPWTHLRLNNSPDDFRFAIVTDRTGGMRKGIFEKAVKQLNLMQPEFVISVGDLIQGTADAKKLDEQWIEFDGLVRQLEMPFFYLPGNHDIGNKVSNASWATRYGRRFYHFVYKDVLFLMLNSEENNQAAGWFSPAQREWVEKTLAEYKDVRWTIVAMHKPVWTYPDLPKTGWLEIERTLMLDERPYTVFAGHKHRYERFIRNGQKYFMLATTGGGSKLRGVGFGEFDQFVWVTMKKDGPRLANLMMDGIEPDDIDTNVGSKSGDKALRK
jgi:3',5'-cyclic AMP phosphodiesterase CpdA